MKKIITKGFTFTGVAGQAKSKLKAGFTLIELLIVMAILGVLAVVVLVAINPAEQLARTRDAGRFSSVTQIGHALQAYYTSHNATYPTESSTFISDLSTSGEMGSVPALITSGSYTECGGTKQSGWCYDSNATDTIVYTRLESQSYQSKCSSGNAYVLFSTRQGRGGTYCKASEPTASDTFVFVN